MFGPVSRVTSGGGGLMGLVRRLVLLGFAVIQLILVARILLDLGVIPADLGLVDAILAWSDALAAPVRGLGDSLGGLFGGGGAAPGLGAGLNPSMLAALVGWSVVEGLILGVVAKFSAA